MLNQGASGITDNISGVLVIFGKQEEFLFKNVCFGLCFRDFDEFVYFGLFSKIGLLLY